MCQISGDLMHEPMLIQSGMTFEREVIERYFKVQRDRYQQQLDEYGDESDDVDKNDYFKCPITQKPVDPDVLIPNKRIQKATQEFLELNPWGYDFDPRADHKTIKVPSIEARSKSEGSSD